MAVDAEVKQALEHHLAGWKDLTPRSMFGAVGYMVGGKMFGVLMEGVVGMKLPDGLRAKALTLAGVSPFRSPSGKPSGQWVQFVVVLEEDVPAVVPWLQAAYDHVASLPSPRGRSRRPTASR